MVGAPWMIPLKFIQDKHPLERLFHLTLLAQHLHYPKESAPCKGGASRFSPLIWRLWLKVLFSKSNYIDPKLDVGVEEKSCHFEVPPKGFSLSSSKQCRKITLIELETLKKSNYYYCKMGCSPPWQQEQSGGGGGEITRVASGCPSKMVNVL